MSSKKNFTEPPNGEPGDIFITAKDFPRTHETFRIFPASPNDEIVISGMAGRFPNADSVEELSHNLYNKIDMITDKEARWSNGLSQELPKRKGVISSLKKFDASFFGIHYKQANAMDPQGRQLIECAYEAILDAGLHPHSLRDSKTGVYVAVCYSETEKSLLFDTIHTDGFSLAGCSRAMMANRVSYCLGLTGPSYTVDTACSSSMFALDCAFSALRSGQCDNALVCGTNLLLHPYTTINFYRLGVLSSDGYCRPFDQHASGYTRSETICAMFLQKARDTKRIYAKVIYSNTNCDGYKTEGITYPSGMMQEKLLHNFYKDLSLDPSMVSYVEAHGTGTRVGDPEECKTLDNVFCKNRKEPLLIGSIKSSIGHTEASSGVCSVTKVLLAFETGLVSPNINFTEIRKEIPALAEGRLKVCSEKTPVPGNLMAVNSFGFGGANAHALFGRFEKEKINDGNPIDNVPRLVLWAGRTKEAVETIFNRLEQIPLDAEFINLLHGIQKYELSGNLYRGYTILEKGETEENKMAKCRTRTIEHFDAVKRPIVWMFTGMGSQWTGMATSLLQIDIFRESIKKSHEVLKPFGLDLMTIITKDDNKMFDNIVNSFVGIAAIQIAIVDILNALNISFDYCIGHSVGELGCGYADGSLTAEQMLLAAYARGLVSIETKVIHGTMAAVGLSYEQIKDRVPEGIEVACHNSCNSVTLSGPQEKVAAFVDELKKEDIFAKEVPCSNIPYHSKYIAEMGPKLLAKLKEIIPKPKLRSPKWICSSVAHDKWDEERTKYSSAEYHTNNLLSPVLFEEASKYLPEDAITMEIAPHGLLQAIIKKCLPKGIHISLTHRANKNNAIFFMSALGKLFLNGITMSLDRIYPAISYPVSRGTPMIAPLIKWDHSQDWFVAEYDMNSTAITSERKITVELKSEDQKYMAGHIIDGRCLLPATSYLHFVRETIVFMTPGQNFNGLDIEFENVKFLRATSLAANTLVNLTIVIHIGSGDFEISEGTTAVMNGNVKVVKNGKPVMDLTKYIKNDDPIVLDSKDFYKELRLRGYNYAGIFKSVTEASADGSAGKIKWCDNWASFMDCMLQINILSIDSRALCLPTSIRRIRINTEKHLEAIAQLDPENPILDVQMCKELATCVCGGIEIGGMMVNSVGRRKPPGTEILEKYEFIPYNCDSIEYPLDEAVSIILQIGQENSLQHKIKVVEIDRNETESNAIIQKFDEAITNIPVVIADLVLLHKNKVEIEHVKVEDAELKTQTNCHYIIAKNCLNDAEMLEQLQNSLTKDGFLILREDRNLLWSEIKCPDGFNLISLIKVPTEALLMLKRASLEIPERNVVTIKSKDMSFEWLDSLRAEVKKGITIAVEQKEMESGLLGLANCIRREPGGKVLRSVQIDDKTAPQFDLTNALYSEQMKLDLAVNIYRNGKWGSYRHVTLSKDADEANRSGHYFANLTRLGDLSTFEWMTGWINAAKSDKLVNIQYSAINFRDVMLATGRLPLEVHSTNRLLQQCVLGLEYSGISPAGERLMGMVAIGAMATQTEYLQHLTWKVPSTMSLRDAATIPVVYTTVYYAFFFYRPISSGKSILIHAGSGGIGLAAIRIALAYGLEVYTTVSSEAKKKFIMDLFPKLKDENIGNSRDCSFEQMILVRTDGKGVDYVLNSLSEDKLAASVRCLGRGGVFLEIGKFDIMNNSKLDMGSFAKEIEFRAVFADNLIYMPKEREIVFKMIEKDLENGLIQPLHSTVFQVKEVEKAFRFLSTGKHIGKVLIQIRETEKSTTSLPMTVFKRTVCDPHMVYIIAGGLGGFGLELADWLVLRGARKVMLSSRRGVMNGYQAYRIKTWETYGCKIIISKADITTPDGCKKLLVESLSHGQIGGIFNLAVLLQDGILENQTKEKFLASFAPKVLATRYLDELSRMLCAKLQYFVVFSSASCGRGNAGQTNYGMANSIMERIIEKRIQDKLPGKAIQWGAVGEVGLVAQMAEDKIDIEIAGTIQQRISACLSALDRLMNSKPAVVSSMVVAQKHAMSKLNLIQSVLHIMGIRDLKTVSKNASLAELGMDSLMAVEIKQALEREFEVNFTAQDLRVLTFAKLQELTDKGVSENKMKSDEVVNLADIQKNMLLRSLGDEKTANEILIPLNTIGQNAQTDALALFIPGVEGVISPVLHKLCKNIEIPMYALQTYKTAKMDNIQDVVTALSKDVLNLFKDKKRFVLVGHSVGGVIAIELAKLLEKMGLTGQLISVDGSQLLFKRFIKALMPNIEATIDHIQNFLLEQMAYEILPDQQPAAIRKVVEDEKTWEDRMDKYISLMSKQDYSKEYLKNIGYGLQNRFKIVLDASENYDGEKMQSNIALIRPTTSFGVEIENDYRLTQYTNGSVFVSFIDGNHLSMLDNVQLYQLINDICMNKTKST